jgi:hypothetical protein
MVTVAIRTLQLEYLVKILDWGRSRSQYIFTNSDSNSTKKFLPTSPKIASYSDSDSTDLGVVVPAVIYSHHALQESITLCFISLRNFLTRVLLSILKFRSCLGVQRADTFLNCNMPWMVWTAQTWLMAATSFTLNRWFCKWHVQPPQLLASFWLRGRGPVEWHPRKKTPNF